MIFDILNENLVEIGIKAGDKAEVINKMLEIACRSGKIKDPKLATRDVFERENLSSTGMQNGIAIPHGKTDAVDELVACMGITEKPINFDSLDGQPASIFLMTLSPKGKGGEHIRFLGEVAKLLRDDGKRQALVRATDKSDLLRVLKAESY